MNTAYTIDPNGLKNYEELKQLCNYKMKDPTANLDTLDQLAYYSRLSLTKEECEDFKNKFLDILNLPIFEQYKLIDDADNLLLLTLYLYDSYWDNEKVLYNVKNGFERLPEIEYDKLPKSYLDMIKAKELASFLKIYYLEKSEENSEEAKLIQIGIKNKKHFFFKDTEINFYFSQLIIKGLINHNQSLFDLCKVFGDLGVSLLINLRSKYTKLEKLQLIKQIDYIVDFELENPLAQRNKDISYICLVLRQYLVGNHIMGSSKKLLLDDHLRFFAEILNLYDMKFSSKKYKDEDYRDNLAVTIREYFNKNKQLIKD
jgi:hypothetical protein